MATILIGWELGAGHGHVTRLLAVAEGLAAHGHRPILALFPGSRRQEVGRHWSLFRETAELLLETHPDTQLAVARAGSIPAQDLEGSGITVVDDATALLNVATAALVKSGTSTLEAVLEDTPHVIAYAMNPLTATLMRGLFKADHIGLPNLVANERVVPEFVQDGLRPTAIASALVELLDEGSEARAKQLADLERIRGMLGEPGAAAPQQGPHHGHRAVQGQADGQRGHQGVAGQTARPVAVELGQRHGEAEGRAERQQGQEDGREDDHEGGQESEAGSGPDVGLGRAGGRHQGQQPGQDRQTADVSHVNGSQLHSPLPGDAATGRPD